MLCLVCVSVFWEREGERRRGDRVYVQNSLRVSIQNVPVCTGTTRTCVSTCARGAGTHGDVLNVHTGIFQCVTLHHDHNHSHSYNDTHTTQHATSHRDRQRETAKEDRERGEKTKEEREDERGETRQEKRRSSQENREERREKRREEKRREKRREEKRKSRDQEKIKGSRENEERQI